MVFGNPFMFAILVERVAEWNDSESEDNGHFAFCIRGEVFPKSIINTPYIIALKNALKALKNEPRKEVLMNDWIREAYETIYHRVYPDEEISKDWNSLYSLYDELSDDLADESFYIFTVKRDNKTVFMAVEYTVDIETQTDILGDKVITTEVDADEIDMIVREMENFICTEELRVHGKKETEEYGTED